MENRASPNPVISFRLNTDYLATQLGTNCICHAVVIQDKGEPSPATCFKAQKNQAVNATILQEWQEFLDRDDVFDPAFLSRIVFCGVDYNAINLTSDAQKLLEAWNTQDVLYQPHLDLPNGPYYISEGVLHSVWKVYDNYQLAFVQALWPATQETLPKWNCTWTKTEQSSPVTFVQTNAAGNGYRGHGIAVLPRSYSQASGSPLSSNSSFGSLAGMRFSIKDNYHVRGTRTSLGNRAYYETYPIQDQHAEAVSLLVAAGAQIVGKVHLSSFAIMEHPTQSVDYQAPFNPRGDGYLIAGGSSGASAAAVATYEWLDISLCSDTTGSARIPAFQNGVFGFRPSTSTISVDGLVHAWAAMDTPGWLGRNIEDFPRVLATLSLDMKELQTSPTSLPVEILYPGDFVPDDSPEQTQAMEHFLSDITSATGSTWRKVSIKDDWQMTAPVNEKDLDQYLYHTTGHGWYYSAYHSFDQFRHDYDKAHGHSPFVTEVVRWYWSLGSKVTKEQHGEIMARFEIFRDWFIDHYQLNGANNKLFALHINKVAPKYRDQHPGFNNPEVPGLRATFLSPILKAPELAIPSTYFRIMSHLTSLLNGRTLMASTTVSQLSYESRITNKEEKIPLVVSLMGAPHSDMELIQWAIESLKGSGRATKVLTGKTAFTG